MTRTAERPMPPPPADPSAGSISSRRQRALFVVGALVVASAAGLGLPHWHNPVSVTLLVLLALSAPSVAYYAAYRSRMPALAATAFAVGTTLAGWALLDYVLISAIHRTRAEVQVPVLVVLLLPALLTCPLPRSGFGALAAAVRRAVSPAIICGAVAVAALGGALLLHLAQDIASTQDLPHGAFAVFWAGMIVLYLPTCALLLLRSTVPDAVRVALLGGLSYLPTFVRSPLKVFNYDEYGHLGEAREIVFTGHLYNTDSTVAIGPKYPGFETLVDGVARLSGLSTVATGQLCIALCHVTVICGIAAIATKLSPHSPRVPVLAALVYAVSPQFIQFDALFSYETLALPLFVLVLLAAVFAFPGMPQEDQDRVSPRLLAGLALLLVSSLLITHHLTTIALAAALLLAASCFAVTSVRRARRDPASGAQGHRAAFVLAGTGILVGASVAAYAAIVRAGLVSYLGAFPRSALHAVKQFVGVDKSTSGNISNATTYNQKVNSTRSLFQGTQLPAYERYTGIAMQFVLFGLCLYVLWIRRRSFTPWLAFSAVLAAAYFASLPLSLVAVANSGAHRTWAFSFIGLALLVSLALEPQAAPDAGDKAESEPTAVHRRTQRLRARLVAAHVLVLLLLMSSYATSVNLYARFRGPYVLGADGRDDTADVQRSAQWLLSHAGPNPRIITTRRTAMVFSATSGARVVPFPGWAIFFPTTQPPQKTLDGLFATGVQYLIADSRLTTEVPTQSYFRPAEPAPPAIPLPAASLNKFHGASWLRIVHRDDNITIYRIVQTG